MSTAPAWGPDQTLIMKCCTEAYTVLIYGIYGTRRIILPDLLHLASQITLQCCSIGTREKQSIDLRQLLRSLLEQLDVRYLKVNWIAFIPQLSNRSWSVRNVYENRVRYILKLYESLKHIYAWYTMFAHSHS